MRHNPSNPETIIVVTIQKDSDIHKNSNQDGIEFEKDVYSDKP